MANSDFDEKQLEELLSKMPKMTDRRNPEEIYRFIQWRVKRKRRIKKSILIPALTAIAAIILFILISPAFVENDKNELASSKSSTFDKAEQKNKSTKQQESSLFLMKSEDESSSKDQTNENMAKSESSKTAVYEDDLINNDVVTYGLFTKDAFLVPISVVVPKSNTDWIDRYKETIKKVPLEQLGFTNIPFLQGNISYDAKTKKLNIMIKRDEWSKVVESTETNLNKIIQYSFASQDVNEVKFTDENGNPVELNNIGEVPNQSIEKTPKTGYYSYKLDDKYNLLLPSDSKFSSLEEALNAMKEQPNDYYNAIIPENANLIVSSTNPDQVKIEFGKKINLLNNSQNNYMEMIEGILLTAKDFGYSSVLFKNIEPTVWGGFSFSEPIKVPFSANRLQLNMDK